MREAAPRQICVTIDERLGAALRASRFSEPLVQQRHPLPTGRSLRYEARTCARAAPLSSSPRSLTTSCSERTTTPPSSPPAAGAHAAEAARPTGTTSLPKSPNAAVDELVRENLDAELVEQPITATWLGVHAWDDRIDDVRPEAQARRAVRLRTLLDRLRAIDEKQLDATHAYDRLLLDHRAGSRALHADRAAAARAQPARLLRSGAVGHLRARHRRFPAAGRSAARDQRAAVEDSRRCSTRRAATCARPAPELAVRRAIEEAQSAKGFIAETLPQARCRACPIPSCSTTCATPRATPSRALDRVRRLAGARPVAARARRLRARARSADGDVAPRRGRRRHARAAGVARRARAQGRAPAPRRRDARSDGKIGRRRRRKLLEEDHGKPEELLTSAQQMLRERGRVRAQAARCGRRPSRSGPR